MKNQNVDQAIGVPVSSVIYAAGELKREAASPVPQRLYLMPASYGSSQFQKSRKLPLFHWMNRFKSKANSYAKGICDHVSLGSTVSQTVKGKLSLGVRILQAGGVGRIFRQNFSVKEGEKLLNAFQCYLSTTAGPISGLLFISSEKIAFRSNRYIKLNSPGETARIPYKVLIPLSRTKKVCQSENMNKPSQKYIEIITEDGFEFWFMGFLSYERSFNFIQKQFQSNR
ncbi:putative GEM-like protein 8 [Dendrobium catenatum]|uniref:putative GEM-like protein 8 n=1 Tax=Dendrobium catenatum TaxID=906689 RepID=UPI0009F25BBE|nr:putative GEM-like protein 8 [Dendrobium catenatum]